MFSEISIFSVEFSRTQVDSLSKQKPCILNSSSIDPGSVHLNLIKPHPILPSDVWVLGAQEPWPQGGRKMVNNAATGQFVTCHRCDAPPNSNRAERKVAVPEQVDRARGAWCEWRGCGSRPLAGAGVQRSESKADEESRVTGADEQEAGRGMKALAPTLVFNASEMEITGVFWIEE